MLGYAGSYFSSRTLADHCPLPSLSAPSLSFSFLNTSSILNAEPLQLLLSNHRARYALMFEVCQKKNRVWPSMLAAEKTRVVLQVELVKALRCGLAGARSLAISPMMSFTSPSASLTREFYLISWWLAVSVRSNVPCPAVPCRAVRPPSYLGLSFEPLLS